MARAHEVHNGIRWSSSHMFLKRRDVGSSTERSASSRYHNDPNGRVEFDAIQRIHYASDQFVAKRVELVGPVQRQDRHWAAILTQENGGGFLLCHAHVSSMLLRAIGISTATFCQ
jgi:hypothetical protein